jgi:hypothetical protein
LREKMPLTGRPHRNQIRGLIGAGLLAVVCVCLSAVIIAWKDGPYPVHDQWPHLDPLLATVVLGPAVLFHLPLASPRFS